LPQRSQARELWADYRNKKNRRVPIVFASDESLWTKLAGYSFREFYTDPEVHLHAQLRAQLWAEEHVLDDTLPDLQERWIVRVRSWMQENEFFGCPVVYQEDDFAWGQPVPLARGDLLGYLTDIDPERRVRESRAFNMYQALEDLSAGMEFADRRVEIAPSGFSTLGPFTNAAEIRGLEPICVDMYESPEFVDKLMQLVTEKTIGRIQAWHKLTGGRYGQIPNPKAFSFVDDNLNVISAAMYERFVLPWHERLYSAMTTGERGIHLCGQCAQHYELLRRKLNVTVMDGPGTFVDHGHYLHSFGPDFRFEFARLDGSVLTYGNEAEIRGMMRRLLTPRSKLPGRFALKGYLSRYTPLQNLATCYQAALEYGAIEPDSVES
jgi:hypothetical protein